MSLEKLVKMNQLFAFYHKLLTQRQQEMLGLYYQEDYSLGEIANYYDISRQAVYDNIRRGERALEEYEEILQLNQRRLKRVDLIEKLAPYVTTNEEANKLLEDLKSMDL